MPGSTPLPVDGWTWVFQALNIVSIVAVPLVFIAGFIWLRRVGRNVERIADNTERIARTTGDDSRHN